MVNLPLQFSSLLFSVLKHHNKLHCFHLKNLKINLQIIYLDLNPKHNLQIHLFRIILQVQLQMLSLKLPQKIYLLLLNQHLKQAVCLGKHHNKLNNKVFLEEQYKIFPHSTHHQFNQIFLVKHSPSLSLHYLGQSNNQQQITHY